MFGWWGHCCSMLLSLLIPTHDPLVVLAYFVKPVYSLIIKDICFVSELKAADFALFLLFVWLFFFLWCSLKTGSQYVAQASFDFLISCSGQHLCLCLLSAGNDRHTHGAHLTQLSCEFKKKKKSSLSAHRSAPSALFPAVSAVSPSLQEHLQGGAVPNTLLCSSAPR